MFRKPYILTDGLTAEEMKELISHAYNEGYEDGKEDGLKEGKSSVQENPLTDNPWITINPVTVPLEAPKTPVSPNDWPPNTIYCSNEGLSNSNEIKK